MPALEKANQEIEKLQENKGALAEIKSFPSPPPGVDAVLYSVMHIIGKEANWPNVKT